MIEQLRKQFCLGFMLWTSSEGKDELKAGFEDLVQKSELLDKLENFRLADENTVYFVPGLKPEEREKVEKLFSSFGYYIRDGKKLSLKEVLETIQPKAQE